MNGEKILLGPKLADGRTAEVFAWGDDQIVKLYRVGWGRNVAEFEYSQAVASQNTGFSVPQVCEIVEVKGRPGLVYQRLGGRTMFDAIQKKPYRLMRFSRQMAELHLDMHSREASGLEPVHERLAGKIDTVEHLTASEKEFIIKRLFSLPRMSRLLHGDFHPANIFLAETGTYIIDWIDAALGHPLADVARTWVLGTFGVPPEEKFGRIAFRFMVNRYLKSYFRSSPYSRDQLEDWLLPVAAGRLSEGIPHEVEPVTGFVRERLRAAGHSAA